MTPTIRHHTDRADAAARSFVPQIKIAKFDKAPDGENVMGLMMAQMARKEGHRGRVPVAYGTGEGSGNGLPQPDVTDAMREAMTIWMTPTEIAQSVSALLGREINTQMINDRLRKNLRKCVKNRQRTPSQREWKLL